MRYIMYYKEKNFGDMEYPQKKVYYKDNISTIPKVPFINDSMPPTNSYAEIAKYCEKIMEKSMGMNVPVMTSEQEKEDIVPQAFPKFLENPKSEWGKKMKEQFCH